MRSWAKLLSEPETWQWVQCLSLNDNAQTSEAAIERWCNKCRHASSLYLSGDSDAQFSGLYLRALFTVFDLVIQTLPWTAF